MTVAIILAGGFGTRLSAHVPGVPKPLAPVSNRPFLEYQIDWLKAQGIRTAILTVHYMAEHFSQFIQSRNANGIELVVIKEPTPLGTGGAVKNAALEYGVEDTVLVINGDTYFDFQLKQRKKFKIALDLLIAEGQLPSERAAHAVLEIMP